MALWALMKRNAKKRTRHLEMAQYFKDSSRNIGLRILAIIGYSRLNVQYFITLVNSLNLKAYDPTFKIVNGSE